MSLKENVKKYGMLEKRFTAKTDFPFDVEIKAVVKLPDKTEKTVRGFYDGDDTFAFRFMPEAEGEYSYRTVSPLAELNGHAGNFECRGSEGHGRVVPDGLYLSHIDGARHHSFGTTAYAWIHQSDEIIEQTLSRLSEGYFNKIRMCVFPKRYLHNEGEPQIYPFEGELGHFDYNRPSPAFFRRLEGYISKLRDMGIEADIILFHPYDDEKWGFANMTKAQDKKYIKYVTSRLSAFSNVWWSAANEYDIFRGGYKSKRSAWKNIIKQIKTADPYGHMLGIHQCLKSYDHSDKNITHCSMQRVSMYLSTELTGALHKKYKKPVVWDEINYEGNIKPTFGNCTADELTRHFWEATARGAYAGHGETYYDENDVIWWSKGGALRGESHKRMRFMREVLASYNYPRFICNQNSEQLPLGIDGDDTFLWYYGNTQSSKTDLLLPVRDKYKIEVIDTKNMIRLPALGEFSGKCEITLPERPYIALIASKITGTPLPEQFDAGCLLRDMKHYKGGKKIYWLLTETPFLRGNEFVLYNTLSQLKEIAPSVVSDKMIRELCGFINDGRIFKHLLSALKKEIK